MKLYLSSYRLGSDPSTLARLVGTNKNAALIPNSLDFSTDLERKSRSVQREIDSLTELGISAEELDLREYFGKRADLEERLETYGMVWVIGGNAFLLRKAMRQSGLDDVMQAYRTRGGERDFVYAGYSAGAVVATRTLRGIELMDPPEVVAEGYGPGVIWDGLGLVEYSIVPHYRSDHPEAAAAERAAKFFEEHGLPFKAIHDGEVIVEHL